MLGEAVVVLVASRFRIRTRLDLSSLPSLPDHQISFSWELLLFVKDLEHSRTLGLSHYTGQDSHEGRCCKVGSRLDSVIIPSSAYLGSGRLCDELSADHYKKKAPEMRPMSFRLRPKMYDARKTS